MSAPITSLQVQMICRDTNSRVFTLTCSYSLQYTEQPSAAPSSQPSSSPSFDPSSEPSSAPSSQPSSLPTSSPSLEPSSQPSSAPSASPSAQPSLSPSSTPTSMPSAMPSMLPSSQPSSSPSLQPSSQPSSAPSSQPSWDPLDFSVEENEFGSFGSMFFVKAKAKITVTSFGIYTDSVLTGPIEVYTRAGKYFNHEVNSTGWSLIFSLTVNMLGQDEATELDVADVEVKHGDYQSFFIWSPTNDIMYNLGGVEGSLYSFNQYTEFYAGCGVEAKFSGDYDDIYAPRVLRGALRFEVAETDMPSQAPSLQPTAEPSSQPSTSLSPSSSPTQMPSSSPSGKPSSSPSSLPSWQPSYSPSVEPSVSPSSSPSSSPSWEGLLLSTASNEFAGNGAMFFVKSTTTKISITSIGFYTENASPNQLVEVYSRPGKYDGHEVNSTGWTQIRSDAINLQGLNVMTHLFDINVDITFGSYQSFFVWSPNEKIMYTVGSNEGDLYSSNTYIDFYEGVGILGKFTGDNGDIKSPRVLRGMLGFEVLPTDVPSTSPTMQPSSQPSIEPTTTPSEQPSSIPSMEPSIHPSSQPSLHPTG